ncbi:MAG: TRAP transporter substrate-binding protein [Thermoleophilia bacterium]
MNKLRFLLTLVLVGLLVVFGLAVIGCGGSEEAEEGETTEETTEGETTEETEAETSEGEAAEAEYVIKFSHVVAEHTPKGEAANKFAELVAEKTGGRVVVEVYPNSQLYNDDEAIEALQLGTIQMAAPSFSKFTGFVPEMQVVDLPFLFESVEQSREAFGGAMGEYLNSKLADSNIRLLAAWDNGFKQLTNNRGPVNSPEDVEGLKFRVQQSDVLIAQMQAWGASAEPMAFSEVYNALEQGVIDAQENTYSNIYSQKYQDVQKYLSETNHGIIAYAVVTSPDFWDSLPEDLRAQVEEALMEATEFNSEIAAQINEENKQMLIEEGMEFNEVDEAGLQAFRDASYPVWDQFADVFGEELMAILDEYRQ